MQNSTIEAIEKQAANLSLVEHTQLIELLTNQLRNKSVQLEKEVDWKELYGVGKKIWDHEDAQDYVNRVREERI